MGCISLIFAALMLTILAAVAPAFAVAFLFVLAFSGCGLLFTLFLLWLID